MHSVLRLFRSSVVVVAALSALGCSRPAQTGPTPSRNVITIEEIESAHARTAYDLVARFRANFLNSRGKNSVQLKTPSGPTVYLDEVEYGAVSTLRSIPATHVYEIRFIEGWDAMAKYGSDHAGGIIQVITRTQ